MEDKIKIDVKADGGSIEVTGESAAALSKLISPFTSLGRVIGERINIWGDLWNLQYTARAVARAREIANDRNLTIEYKPAKFLKDWTLKSSLEDDEEMVEMWAHLLLSASPDYDARDSIHASILSNLGKEEANLLNKIWQVSSEHQPVEYYEGMAMTPFKLSFWDMLARKTLPKEDCPYELISDEEIDQVIYRISSELRAIGLYPVNIEVISNEKILTSEIRALESPEMDLSRYLVASCEHLGLLKRGRLRFDIGSRSDDSQLSFTAIAYGISRIGFGFMNSVNPRYEEVDI